MIELIAVAALVICVIVISFVIRIYRKSPKISRNTDGEEFNKRS